MASLQHDLASSEAVWNQKLASDASKTLSPGYSEWPLSSFWMGSIRRSTGGNAGADRH